MAGVTFTFEYEDAGSGARLADIVARMERPEGLYKGVGDYLTQIAVPRNFDAQTAPDGTAWASLSKVTIKRRAAAGYAATPILTVTKDLRSSVISQPADGGIEVGSAVIYAGVMQRGAAQGQFGASMGKDKNGRDHFHHLPWGDIPARPYLGLSDADQTEIIAIASDWLEAE